MWTALLLLALQAAAAAAAADSPSDVQCDLFYSTATRCGALDSLPVHEDLRSKLLPHAPFTGFVTLAKADASQGCALHLLVDGELSGSTEDSVFSLVSQVDKTLMTLVETHALRGFNGLEGLELERLHVQYDNRDLSIDARAVGESATGVVTMNGDECGEFADTELLRDLLGAGVDDVAVVPGQVDIAKCSVGLNILGRSPAVESTSGAVAFLKSVDKRLDDWFGSVAPKQTTATLKSARVAFSPPKSMMLEGQTTGRLASHANAPPKQITLGILVGLAVLSAMLVGVAYQKRRHEQGQQLRYSNASQAAQIRRVSYRMGYEPVFAKERGLDVDEEEKDGLL